MEAEPVDTLPSEADILHPELLSKEEIISILGERCHLKVDNPEQVMKSTLVQLFQRTVMPLPQRVPRGNRRGRRTKVLIKRLDVKKPLGKATEFQNPKRSPQVKKGLLISSDLNLSSGSRLKPPPIVISKKRAILSPSSSSSSPSSPSNVSLIRTGISKVSINTARGASNKVGVPSSSSNGTPGRTKIVFSSNRVNLSRTGPIATSPELDNESGISAMGDADTDSAITNTRVGLEPGKKEQMGNGNTGSSKRTYITFSSNSSSEKKTSPSHLKISGAAKNSAVHKASPGNGSQVMSESPPQDNGGSEKKRKKITWP